MIDDYFSPVEQHILIIAEDIETKLLYKLHIILTEDQRIPMLALLNTNFKCVITHIKRLKKAVRFAQDGEAEMLIQLSIEEFDKLSYTAYSLKKVAKAVKAAKLNVSEFRKQLEVNKIFFEKAPRIKFTVSGKQKRR